MAAEYMKRANNMQDLLANLKEVNMVIQRSASMRVGAARTRVVTGCRAAVKKNNIDEFIRIIQNN
jgi:Bardet-Biedl syndrome 2 protein